MTGMESVISLPLGPASPRRLLDFARPLPGTLNAHGQTEAARWLQGVKWNPWPCTGLAAGAPHDCDTETLAAITQTCETAETQVPFVVRDAIKMSTLEYNDTEVEAMLRARWDLMVSAAFASELVSGAASSGKSLRSEAVGNAPADIAYGSAAVTISKAVAVLEDHLASKIVGQRGVIHLPPGLLTLAVTECDLVLGDGGFWETPNGNYVIADAGYNGTLGPTGQAAASALEGWVYASGMVYVASTAPIAMGGNEDAPFLRRNEIHEWLQGYGILVFDPCPVSAVLANYTVV